MSRTIKQVFYGKSRRHHKCKRARCVAENRHSAIVAERAIECYEFERDASAYQVGGAALWVDDYEALLEADARRTAQWERETPPPQPATRH